MRPGSGLHEKDSWSEARPLKPTRHRRKTAHANGFASVTITSVDGVACERFVQARLGRLSSLAIYARSHANGFASVTMHLAESVSASGITQHASRLV